MCIQHVAARFEEMNERGSRMGAMHRLSLGSLCQGGGNLQGQ